MVIINELIAMRIAKGDNFNSTHISYFNSVLNTEDTQKAEAIANTILNYTSYSDLLLSSEYFKKHPLFRLIILSILKITNIE